MWTERLQITSPLSLTRKLSLREGKGPGGGHRRSGPDPPTPGCGARAWGGSSLGGPPPGAESQWAKQGSVRLLSVVPKL